MACAPSLSAVTAVPTLDSIGIDQIIAQTANAAATQTVAADAFPLPTDTGSPAPRPTNTPKPKVTPTLTYIFRSPTAFVISPISQFGSGGNKDYACSVVSAPENGSVYSPREEFTARWLFKNTGRKEWKVDEVFFLYDSGDRFHKVASYGLSDEERLPGEIAEFILEMRAPKNVGAYTTFWTLKAGDIEFCKVGYTIGVK
jgi:hypothetical protein